MIEHMPGKDTICRCFAPRFIAVSQTACESSESCVLFLTRPAVTAERCWNMARVTQSNILQTGAGNVIQVIGPSNEEGKPLSQCTPEELKQEDAGRRRLLQQERQRQWLLLFKLLVWLLSGGGATWITSHWLPWTHWLSLALIFGGVLVPGMALYALSKQGESEFAQRQIATLKEIAHLLREKHAT